MIERQRLCIEESERGCLCVFIMRLSVCVCERQVAGFIHQKIKRSMVATETKNPGLKERTHSAHILMKGRDTGVHTDTHTHTF